MMKLKDAKPGMVYSIETDAAREVGGHGASLFMDALVTVSGKLGGVDTDGTPTVVVAAHGRFVHLREDVPVSEVTR